MKEYIRNIIEEGKFCELAEDMITGMEESMLVSIERDTNYVIDGFGREDLSVTIEKNNEIFTVLLWRNNEELVKIYNHNGCIGSLPEFMFDEIIYDMVNVYAESRDREDMKGER